MQSRTGSGATGSTLNNTQRPCTSVLLVVAFNADPVAPLPVLHSLTYIGAHNQCLCKAYFNAVRNVNWPLRDATQTPTHAYPDASGY